MRCIRGSGLLFAALLSVVPAVVAGGAFAGEETCVISGVAVSIDTQTPIGSGDVTLIEANRVDTLAADGSFRFEGLKPGIYMLKLRGRAGERSNPTAVQVSAGQHVSVTLRGSTH